jgi:hypothetical protein
MDERRAYNAQCQRRRRADSAIWEEENKRKQRRGANPATRKEENKRNRESHRRRRANSAIREEENERNRESYRRRCGNSAIREEENVRNRESHRRRCANPAIREEENVRNRESYRRRCANPAIREEENAKRAVARSNGVVDMACKYINGKYVFHQLCGIWNVPCRYGCGYIHLSTSTPGIRKKCCTYGRLSSVSEEFDEELMVNYELDPLPDFLRCILFTKMDFTQKSLTYNNLVAMAATVVCNYRNTNGFTRHGEGPQSVFMNGCVHHYIDQLLIHHRIVAYLISSLMI